VWYHLEFSDTLDFLTISDLTDTSVAFRLDSIAAWIYRRGVAVVSGNRDLLATDGLDTSWVTDGPLALTVDITTLELYEILGIPKEFALHQNYPNPFNPVAVIRFDLPVVADVRLLVYDILGRQVAALVSERMSPGYHSVLWQGRDDLGRPVPTGIYIARLVTPDYIRSIKMLLLK
jgi:hypothetical protein